ncbi:MAG: hypothetical protein J6T01_04090 [Kiritimatiellae bacterium]|nr:hypothetical protein [Kiritimatiellia bacterium]
MANNFRVWCAGAACAVSVLGAGTARAEFYSWAWKGADTNNWFAVSADGTNGFNRAADEMPTSEDSVFIGRSGGACHVTITNGQSVSLLWLSLAADGDSTTGDLVIEEGGSLTVTPTAKGAWTISLGARDGGTGVYRNYDDTHGYLTLNGGTLTCGASTAEGNAQVISIGDAWKEHSSSRLTINSGNAYIAGVKISEWGRGELEMNGGKMESTGAITVGSSIDSKYPYRYGSMNVRGGLLVNKSTLTVTRLGCYVQTGGVVSNLTNNAVIGVNSDQRTPYGVMEMRGGTFFSGCGESATGHSAIFPQGTKKAAANCLRISIYGTMEYFGCRGIFGAHDTDGYTNQLPFVEYVMAEGRVTPITLDILLNTGYSNYSCDRLRKWVRPDGGLQLIATNRFALFRNTKVSMQGRDTNTRYPNAALWEWVNFGRIGKYMEEGCRLKDSVKVDGELAEPVPFGYIELPPKSTNRVMKAFVDMTLVPQGEATFAGIVDEMSAAGHDVAVTGENTVRVQLPVSRLGDRARDRKLLFDFTRQDAPYDAAHGLITTNALVSSISYGTVGDGMMLMIR